MIRPPPLQLKIDNRFPHPVKSARPKSTSFLVQLYQASWKNAIIAVAGLNSLRHAFGAYNAFGDATVDELEDAENLFMVSIALGVMYLLCFLIEVYGLIGVSMQRLGLIRAYLYLTFFASMLITAAGAVKGISYFVFAEEILVECASLATQGRGYEKSLFRSRPWPESIFALTEKRAHQQCVYAWVHDSWNQVAAVFLFSLIPSIVYSALVYTYSRQVLDPKHNAYIPTETHQLVSAVRAEAYPQVGYSRVSNNADDSNGRSVGMTTSRLLPAQTPGLRTARRRETRSLRGVEASNTNRNVAGQTKPTFTSKSLKRDRRPPPLIQSPSPIGFTPPPPTYGPSRVYAAFAAPISDSSEYDKFV